MNDKGERVIPKTYLLLSNCQLFHNVQVYLVTGGNGLIGGGFDPVTTTEIFQAGALQWTQAAPCNFYKFILFNLITFYFSE